jgi:polyribonucleotide nucleotidyltransferase
MLSQPIKATFDIGGGRIVTLETGRLARQADGSVTVPGKLCTPGHRCCRKGTP